MYRVKFNVIKYLCACLVTSLLLTFFINYLTSSVDCNCENYDKYHHSSKQRSVHVNQHEIIADPNVEKKLAIIVPFRDRFDELLQFVPHITSFLHEQKVAHQIFVINQADKYRFNRASLINVGFLFIRDHFDYLAMHDVDLLPLNSELKYEFPSNGPIHIAAPGLHPKYNYPTFIGGILLLKIDHFTLLNGMSNKYWGWGLEDDEFYVRIKDAGLKVFRPENIKTGSKDTFSHIHDRNHRRRDTAKCFNQKEETRKRDQKTGLDTIRYHISDTYEMTINAIKITVLNVHLECDHNVTPWCDCSAVDALSKEKLKAKTKRGL